MKSKRTKVPPGIGAVLRTCLENRLWVYAVLLHGRSLQRFLGQILSYV